MTMTRQKAILILFLAMESLAFASTPPEKISCGIKGINIHPDGGISIHVFKNFTVASSHSAFIETIDLEGEKYDLGIKYIQATKTAGNFLDLAMKPNGLGSSEKTFELSLRDVSLYLEPRLLVKAPEQSFFSHFEVSCRLGQLQSL